MLQIYFLLLLKNTKHTHFCANSTNVTGCCVLAHSSRVGFPFESADIDYNFAIKAKTFETKRDAKRNKRKRNNGK